MKEEKIVENEKKLHAEKLLKLQNYNLMKLYFVNICCFETEYLFNCATDKIALIMVILAIARTKTGTAEFIFSFSSLFLFSSINF